MSKGMSFSVMEIKTPIDELLEKSRDGKFISIIVEENKIYLIFNGEMYQVQLKKIRKKREGASA